MAWKSRTKRADTVRHHLGMRLCLLVQMAGSKHLCILHSALAAIAAAFPKVVKPVEGEPLVIQYEVKLETAHNCGGMYVLLSPLAMSSLHSS